MGAGNKTLKVTDIQQGLDATFCRGYVVGIADAMISMSVNNTTTYCIPTDADNDQLIRIAVKYLNDNPAKLHYAAGLLVLRAIAEAFPCKAE